MKRAKPDSSARFISSVPALIAKRTMRHGARHPSMDHAQAIGQHVRLEFRASSGKGRLEVAMHGALDQAPKGRGNASITAPATAITSKVYGRDVTGLDNPVMPNKGRAQKG